MRGLLKWKPLELLDSGHVEKLVYSEEKLREATSALSKERTLSPVLKPRLAVHLLTSFERMNASHHPTVRQSEDLLSEREKTETSVIEFVDSIKTPATLRALFWPSLLHTNPLRMSVRHVDSRNFQILGSWQLRRMGLKYNREEYAWLVNKLRLERNERQFYRLVEHYIDYLKGMRKELATRGMNFKQYRAMEQSLYPETGIKRVAYYPSWYLFYLDAIYKNDELSERNYAIFFSSSYDWNHVLKGKTLERNIGNFVQKDNPVVCMQADAPSEFVQRLRAHARAHDKCKSLIINMHGNNDVFGFSQEHILKVESLGEKGKLIRKVVEDVLKTGGQIVLLGCSHGVENGLAVKLREICHDMDVRIFAYPETTSPYDEITVGDNGVEGVRSVYLENYKEPEHPVKNPRKMYPEF